MTATPFTRYDFVHQPDGTWTWQCTNVDGSATGLSAPHASIDAAKADALTFGFRPTVDHWFIDNVHALTYFEPGRPPKTLSKPNGRTVPLQFPFQFAEEVARLDSMIRAA